ncbi:G-protein coupled receptor 54-like isoform X2 [Amphiura filiformis]
MGNIMANVTKLPHDYEIHTPPPLKEVFHPVGMLVLTVTISIIAAVGIVANCVVIFIVIRYKDMHKTVNYAFANLAVTDLMLLLLDAIPTAFDTAGLNLSAKLGCNIAFYLQYITAQVTSLTLAFLSFDRCRLVLHPLKSLGSRSSKQIFIVFLLIWIVSSILQVPIAFVSGTTATGQCAEYNLLHGQQFFFIYSTFTLYIFPLIIVICCYLKIGHKMLGDPSAQQVDMERTLKQKRRSLILILIVVLFLALCWLPVHTVHLWMAFHPVIRSNSISYIKVHTAANVLMFINSSSNPFLYTLAGSSFRMHLNGMLTSMCTFTKLGRLCKRKYEKPSSIEANGEAFNVYSDSTLL